VNRGDICRLEDLTEAKPPTTQSCGTMSTKLVLTQRCYTVCRRRRELANDEIETRAEIWTSLPL
jgi:hypothetical protein